MSDTSGAPLSQLIFDDAFFPALRNTDVTLRKGELNVAAGAFNFVARRSGEVIPVQVTDVQCRPFRDIASEIFERDGKGSKEATLCDMKRFYPDMTPETPVTVISYKVL